MDIVQELPIDIGSQQFQQTVENFTMSNMPGAKNKSGLSFLEAFQHTYKKTGKVEIPPPPTIDFENFLYKIEFAKNVSANIVLGLGHGTTIAETKKAREFFLNLGFNVATVPLPDMQYNIKTADGMLIGDAYEKHAGIVLDPSAPIYQELPSDVPTYLFTHSSFGLGMESHILKNPEKGELCDSMFASVVHGATMLDTVSSSKKFNPGNSSMYTFYTFLPFVSQQLVGATGIDCWKQDMPFSLQLAEELLRNPTHQQAREIKKYAIKHVRAFEKHLKSDPNSPFVTYKRNFFGGTKEDSVSLKTILYYADRLPNSSSRTVPHMDHGVLSSQRGLSAIHKASTNPQWFQAYTPKDLEYNVNNLPKEFSRLPQERALQAA